MFTWLCVSPMHFFFHFENLQYNYHAQTRVWDWGSGPPQFHPLPPPLKKRNPLNLGLPWSGGGPPHPPLPWFSGSRHHYTTSFIKVKAEIYPCKSPGERISFWHFTNKLTWFLVGFTITGYIPNTGSCTAEAIIPDYTTYLRMSLLRLPVFARPRHSSHLFCSVLFYNFCLLRHTSVWSFLI